MSSRCLPSRFSRGWSGAAPESGVAVINLNLRSVVAEPEEDQPSILERLIVTHDPAGILAGLREVRP